MTTRSPLLSSLVLLLVSPLAAQADGPSTRDLTGGRNREVPLLRPAGQSGASPPQIAAPPPPQRPQSPLHPAGPQPEPTLVLPELSPDRPLIEVDGQPVLASDLAELLDDGQAARPGTESLRIRDAFEHLIARAAVAGRYAGAVSEMRERIDGVFARLQAGEPFDQLRAEFTQDDEEPEDGRYRFGRGQTVQPFDAHLFASTIGQPTSPFLTVYGFHILEVLEEHPGLLPGEEERTVRHILVMFPFEEEDPREEIRKLKAASTIRILDPAFRNAIPPELRSRIVETSTR